MDMRQQQRGREPSFEEAVDIADEVRQWRRKRRKVIAMRVVAALPLTGGMTDRQWLFVGGAVGGLAVLLIGAAGVWNGKKRLV